MLGEYQLKKLGHLFRILDFDHNGLLQKSDFDSIADNISIFAGIVEDQEKELRLKKEATVIWSKMTQFFRDPNLEFLDQDQWIHFMKAHFYDPSPRTIESNIYLIVRKLHEVFDKNSDIRISRLEFMSIFVSFRVEVRYADQCFKSIDTNGDGFISETELLNATMEFFRSDNPEDAGNLLFGNPESIHFATRRAFY